jgi:hypothetical protein
MQIMPINNFTFWNTPYANLFIQGTTNEVSIIDRVELDACHWNSKQYKNLRIMLACERERERERERDNC